jgi:hypothetical protein
MIWKSGRKTLIIATETRKIFVENGALKKLDFRKEM